jgi:HSP20 family protein
MWGYHFSDLDRTLAAVDGLRRMGRVFVNLDTRGQADDGWPRTSVYETKDALVVVAEVPGLTEKDLEVTLDKRVLTLSGARKLNAPEELLGQAEARQPERFSRSFTVPDRIATEGLTADLKDGLLTVRLPKVPEVQPRKIPIKAPGA